MSFVKSQLFLSVVLSINIASTRKLVEEEEHKHRTSEFKAGLAFLL